MNDLLELFPNFAFEDEPFHDASPDDHASQFTKLDLAPLEFVVL